MLSCQQNSGIMNFKDADSSTSISSAYYTVGVQFFFLCFTLQMNHLYLVFFTKKVYNLGKQRHPAFISPVLAVDCGMKLQIKT